MTNKKKTTGKSNPETARFAIGQKTFIIDYGRKPGGEVLQSEVGVVREVKYPINDDAGKKTGTVTKFEYDVVTANGNFYELPEFRLYPTITAVALAFTQNFTTLLK